MNAKLTDADLMVLATALLNKLNHVDTSIALSDVEILIEHLEVA
jgi:hypothetical protein